MTISGHPQTSPRGFAAHAKLAIGSNGEITGNTTGIVLSAGVKVSNAQTITANSTTIIHTAGIKISNAQTLTANTTGILHSNEIASLPGNVDNGKLWGLIFNSTGVSLFLNTTGTTHKFLQVTSQQPS